MIGISKLVRAAVLARLSDPTSGINPQLATATTAYGIAPITFDLSGTSKQLFQGYVTPDDLEESTAFKYPALMLYCVSSENQNLQKSTTFAGRVEVGLDIHLTWKSGSVIPTMEDICDAVECAIYETFNAPGWAASYGAPIVYNGELTHRRTPVQLAGENWRQSLLNRLTFEVFTN